MRTDSKFRFIINLLAQKGFVKEENIETFTRDLKEDLPNSQEIIEAWLIEKGLVSEENLLRVYSEHLNMPYRELKNLQVAPSLLGLVPAKFANRNKVMVMESDGQNLTVAIRHPFNLHIIDELEIITGLKIKPVISKEEEILNAIKTHYGVGAETLETIVKDSKLDAAPQDKDLDKDSLEDIEKMAEAASIIKYVNQILLEAYRKRATDIHIEPFEHTLRIRYRVDGVLQEVKVSPEVKKLQIFIISRLKIMANLNIAEKRMPQDGRCKIKLEGEEVDLRLATFPTLFGEGVSIRLLNRSMVLFGIDQLGLSADAVDKIKAILKKPNGMALVTGPTGCGKTTTLYACLNYINNAQLNIITLEDPVEYQLEGINQIQINTQIGLSFATGLRSILRQDPDVIMVGEIRDLETAQIAIRCALTGHLLFSTLHTNDAVATVNRLLELGIEPYLVSGTVKVIIAQRLVRKICADCKIEYKPEGNFLFKTKGVNNSARSIHKFYKGKGCTRCEQTGYRGRIGIYEILITDEQIAAAIASGAPKAELDKIAKQAGMNTLLEDGLEKVKAGITTIEEVLRVTEEA